MNPAFQRAYPIRLRQLQRWWMRLLAALILVLACYHGWVFLQVWQLRNQNPHMTAFMRGGLARLQSHNPGAQLQHRWVPYAQISVNLKRAVIAAEDQKFLDHEGFDVEEI